MISIWVSSLNGVLPSTNSYNTIPEAQTSTLSLYVEPYNVSGALYSKVPVLVHRFLLFPLRTVFVIIPKSMICNF